MDNPSPPQASAEESAQGETRVRSSYTPNSWRPPTYLLIIIAVLLLGLAGAAWGAYSLLTARNVTLIIDGRRQDIQTHQATVAALLADLHLPAEPADKISLPVNTTIQNGLTLMIVSAHPVVIDADGQRRRVWTQLVQPADILKEVGISVGPHDVIRADNGDLKLQPYTVAPQVIAVQRAISLQLDDDGTISTLYTVQPTVGETLNDAKITLYVADIITPDVNSPVTDGLRISLRRSVPITIQADGRALRTRTHAATVSDALADAGIALVGLDASVPDASTPVTPSMTIRVIRITEEDETIGRALVDFKRVEQPDSTLPLDSRQMVQQGVQGVIEQRVRVRREDGVEVSRSAVENVPVQAVKDEIWAVGTLPILRTLQTPGGDVQYWRKLTVQVASYEPASTGRDADDPLYGITSTGQKLRKGLVAVDPTVIPLGAQVYIPDYGIATAADIGGSVQGLTIDLGYSDDDYREWSGTADVYLLPPIPPTNQIPTLPENRAP